MKALMLYSGWRDDECQEVGGLEGSHVSATLFGWMFERVPYQRKQASNFNPPQQYVTRSMWLDASRYVCCVLPPCVYQKAEYLVVIRALVDANPADRKKKRGLMKGTPRA